jgi:hypothetical protein
MITILTGNPGHGKSYTAVKMIDEFVHRGHMVVTNVPLRDDWAYQMARYHTPFGGIRKKAVAKKEAKFRKLVHIVKPLPDGSSNLAEILKVRFSGEKEGRGKVVIDESQREMNVRKGKAADEKEDRLATVNYVSAHRHYGADVVLITQNIANLDIQIRNLYEFHAEVRNFRKLPFASLIARLFPGGQLFLRTTHWSDKAKTKAGAPVMYGLSKRLASLYTTHALQEHDWPDDAIILPWGSPAPIRKEKAVNTEVDFYSKLPRELSPPTDISANERKRRAKKERREENSKIAS